MPVLFSPMLDSIIWITAGWIIWHWLYRYHRYRRLAKQVVPGSTWLQPEQRDPFQDRCIATVLEIRRDWVMYERDRDYANRHAISQRNHCTIREFVESYDGPVVIVPPSVTETK